MPVGKCDVKTADANLMRDNSRLDASPTVNENPFHPLITRVASVRLARNGLSVLVFALVAYYALFRLPFRFPPRQRLMSPSYTFGFNNSVAILAVTALLGGVTLLYFLRKRGAIELPIAFPCQPAAEVTRSAKVTLAVIAVCYAGLTFAMYVYNVRLAPPIMWETRHLLHRTLLMDVYGLRPYTDVAAEYGPILTYAPSYIYWLLQPLGASHEQAYFACHLLLNLAGLYCAYYVLSHAVMSARTRLVAFAILATAGFLPYMGVNGVLLRYLFPFASLLLGHRALAFMFSRRHYLASWIGAVISVLLLLAANILLSPEIGLAFAIAWLGYALLTLCSEARILAVSLIAFVCAALLCRLFLPVAYYDTLLRFSEGANNLPLLPAAHLLLYIFTLFLVVPPLLVVSMCGWLTRNAPSAAICGALGILCAVMAPGALGRCDPPHVLLFGMGASMLLMIRLANISNRVFVAYAIAYTAVFIVFIEVVNLRVYYGVSPKTLLSFHPFADITAKFWASSDASHPDITTLSALDRYPRLGLPFASLGDPAVERYVIANRKLEPEYYVAIVGVYSSAALERKLRDVSKSEYLLVPFDLASENSPSDLTLRVFVEPNPCAGSLKWLRQWFLYPAELPCRADPLNPMKSL
jgi:hypothetical protein